MRNRSLVFITMAMLLTPAICSAQQTERWRDSAQRAYSAMRAMHDSLLQGDSTLKEVARQGDFGISASPNQSANAAVAFDRFMRVSAHRFGQGKPSAGGFRIVVRTDVGMQMQGNIADHT